MNLPDFALKGFSIRYGAVLPQLVAHGGEKAVRSEEARPRGTRLVTFEDETRILVTSKKTIGDTEEPYVLSEWGGRLTWLRHPWQKRFHDELALGISNWREMVRTSWQGKFAYIQEEKDAAGVVTRDGLRTPQIGALHAIGAHWTLGPEAATVVMPTGTGKTETMLGVLIDHRPSCMLVVVPSDALRSQVANKFRGLGVLPSKGVIPVDIMHPVVGILKRRPKAIADLDVFRRCNVVVATASSIAQGTAANLGPEISALCSHLVIDEAHHVAAATWSKLKSVFAGKPVLQFTATPFRRDSVPVEGKIIYNYPLRMAQEAGFFKPINFRAIFEVDRDRADRAIAAAALDVLRRDIAAGLDHKLMARCNSRERAESIFNLYQELGAEFEPVLIHSALSDADARVQRLVAGASRIVVCVNMLSEGFDLPQLKVAAVHDKHESLSVLLQFVGRFSRAIPNVGDATVVTNTAGEARNAELSKLYSEDADWRFLVADISYQLIEQQERLLEYLAEAESLLPVDTQVVNIQLPLLRPKIGAVIFDVPELAEVNLRVTAQQLRDAHLPSGFVPRSILHMPNTLVLVGDLLEGVDWSLSHEMVDHDWHYFIIFHDVERRLLFIGSSMLKELHDGLATAVSGGVATRFIGPTVLRVFGNINRLRFLQAGVMKIGGRRHRYSMVTGQDVKGAIEAVSGESASPSNFTGVGYSGGLPCSVGCSVKGKVWARDDGNISEFRSWCQGVGRKLRDATLNTEAILDLSLLAVSVDVVPNDILALDAMWPNSILGHDEARVEIGPPSGAGEKFYVCDLAQVEMAADRKSIAFDVIAGANKARMRMTLDGGPAKGFSFVHETGPVLEVRIGRTVRPLTEYFQDEPVSFLFSDGSELEGSFHFPVRGFESSFPDTSLHPVAWTGVDIQKESIWDEGVVRPDSIQQRSFEICRNEGFELIFNDDDHGEAADLVCMRREANKIHIRLVHCKFSHEATPGVRLADVVEVASQAVRSARWRHSFETLCEHILHRERVLFGKPEGFRYLLGDRLLLNTFKAEGRFREVAYEVVCVQPGVTKSGISNGQRMILGAANRYLIQTAELPISVWCSA